MAKSSNCPNCDRPTMRTKDWACQWCGYPLVSGSFQQILKTYKEVRAERINKLAPSEAVENAKCPNCDLPTMRTKDWACQWCGYPLVSGSFQQILKTYQEVRAERINKLAPSEAVGTDVPVNNVESATSEVEAESAAVVPILEDVESDSNRVIEFRPEPEVIPVKEKELEPISEADETLGIEIEVVPNAELEQESEVEPVMKHKSIGENSLETIGEITVAELCSSYQSYGMAGHDEFMNRVFRVTGIVDRIVIKDTISQYYIDLNDSKPHTLGYIRCKFVKEDVSALNRLTIGRRLTIQGKYDGFVTNIILANCIINYE